MKEIEIKLRVENTEGIIKQLEAKGCVFDFPVKQEDNIFIPSSEPTVPVTLGTNVLRIRRQGGKNLFTLKQGQELAKIERELEIFDPKALEEIILMLGFKKIAQINKTRRKCKMDGLEICVDEVDGLGSFVEVEKITAEDPGEVQEQLLDFVAKLGVDVSCRETVGYDILFVQKYGQNPI